MAASTPRLAPHKRPWPCNKAGLVRVAPKAKCAGHQRLHRNELLRLKHAVAAPAQDNTSVQLVSSEGTDLDILSHNSAVRQGS